MSNRYGFKKSSEARAAAKGPRKIGPRGALNRRVVKGWHVTKGRPEIPGHEIANTLAGELFRSFIP